MVSVSSVSPLANANGASIGSDIILNFTQPINASTVNDATVKIIGSLSGPVAGSFSVSSNVVTFNPATDLTPGEQIQVVVTSGVQDSLSNPADPFVYEFTAAVSSSTGELVDNGQTFANTFSRGVSLGDVDGDGDFDALVTNVFGGSNEIWLNDGAGNFSAGSALATSSYGAGLGDLDGDGDLDAFLANFDANEVWLNDGSGNFSDTGQTLGSSNSQNVSLGDLDGDGDLDAFVANSGGADQVWLNDGSGNFASGQTLGSSTSQDVSLGDLDGDGDLDAFVAAGENPGGAANQIWLNDGSGNFTGGQTLGSSISYGIDLGDLDGDGDLDAFVANAEGQANQIWINQGTSGFSAGQTLGSGDSKDVNLGDLDGDGDLDAYIANSNDEANEIWLNNGSANFSLNQTLGSSSSDAAALADLDGDGALDAFDANLPGGSQIWLSQGILRVVSAAPAANVNNATNSSDIAITFNQSVDSATVDETTIQITGSFSGKLDGSFSVAGNVVTFNPASNFQPGETIQVSVTSGVQDNDEGNPAEAQVYAFQAATSPGTGGLTNSGQILGSETGFGVQLGDLNGDGSLDAAVANFSGQANRVWLNDGSGGFSPGASLGNGDSLGLSLGDIDGDGDLDAVVANFSGQDNEIWLNNGSGSFSSGSALGAGDSTAVDLGDVDGDGDLDAFVTNFSGQGDRVWLNDGSGSFTDSGQTLGASDSRSVRLGDLDGDGDLDAFVTNFNGQGDRVFLNDGSGNFADSGQALGANNGIAASLGDLDGDGDLDAFVANAGSDQVWLNDGQGVFSAGQSFAISPSNGVSLKDIDGDGDLDAVTAVGGGNQVWDNDGSGNFSDSGQLLGSSNSNGVDLGDFDGDGVLDAFFTNSDGSDQVWRNRPNTAPTITTSASFTQPENTLPVATVAATDADGDTLTFSISGGADQSQFAINPSSGELSFVSAPDFEVPADSGTDNTYEVEVTVDDGNGNGTDSQSLTITITDDNDAPDFTSSASPVVDEEQTTVITVAATDQDGETPTFSLSGGADQASFSLNGTTGELSFNSAPNFEAPSDANGDNVYEVEVTADDGVGGTSTQVINVTVQNVAEPSDDPAYFLWRNTNSGDLALWKMADSSLVEGGFLTLDDGTPLTLADPNWSIGGIGDLDADGQSDDFIWRNSVSGETAAWFMDDTTLVGSRFGFANDPSVSGAGWSIEAVGDFDGSGSPDDLVFRNLSTGENKIITNDGGAFASVQDFLSLSDLNWDLGGVGEFDGDGEVDDIVWHNTVSGEVAIWYMNGSNLDSGVFVEFGPNLASGISGVNEGDPVQLIGDGWTPSGVSDIDSDGVSDDLLWRNDSLGQTVYWSIENGNQLDASGTITPELPANEGWVVATGGVSI